MRHLMQGSASRIDTDKSLDTRSRRKQITHHFPKRRNSRLRPRDTRSIDNLYLILTAKIAIAAGLYIIIMQLSKSATFKEVINYLSKKK